MTPLVKARNSLRSGGRAFRLALGVLGAARRVSTERGIAAAVLARVRERGRGRGLFGADAGARSQRHPAVGVLRPQKLFCTVVTLLSGAPGDGGCPGRRLATRRLDELVLGRFGIAVVVGAGIDDDDTVVCASLWKP